MMRHFILTILCFLAWHVMGFQTSYAQNGAIEGIVYVDHNGNASKDAQDFGHPAIRVNIYHDLNANNYKDDQDTLITFSTSDYDGKFSISLTETSERQYIAELESKDLPTDARMTATSKAFNLKQQEQILLGFKGAPVFCYAIGDGSSPDRVVMVNRMSGHHQSLKGDLGTRYVEAMAVTPGGKSIFAVNKDKLGKIDLPTGDFKPMIDTMGTGRGSLGPHRFEDIDALAFDPFSARLYAAERKSGGRDLLCILDTLTGKIVPDAFGEGVDYVVMEGDKGVQAEIDGLAISPINGKMYGINNFSNVTHYDFLVEIDKKTGFTHIIDTLKVNKKYLHDAEGLGFTNDGQLQVTTGTSAATDLVDAIFSVNIKNAKATQLTNFSESSDYESCDCLIGMTNKVSGTIFEDLNQNATQDRGEVGLKNTRILFYKDNGDGQVGVGDILLDSVYTDEKGAYEWTAAANIDMVIEIKKDDLPIGYEFSNRTVQTAYLGGSIGAEEDNDNHFAVAHGSYLKEWLAFSEVRQQSQAMWASSKLERDMMASKSAKQSIGVSMPVSYSFGSVGTVASGIAFEGASADMLERATQPVVIQRMSMKDPFLTGIRYKPIETDGTAMTANAKEFLEAQLPSWISPSVACQLMRAAKGPKEIVIENNDLKPGTYFFQAFNRTDVCLKKIIIKHE